MARAYFLCLLGHAEVQFNFGVMHYQKNIKVFDPDQSQTVKEVRRGYKKD